MCRRDGRGHAATCCHGSSTEEFKVLVGSAIDLVSLCAGNHVARSNPNLWNCRSVSIAARTNPRVDRVNRDRKFESRGICTSCRPAGRPGVFLSAPFGFGRRRRRRLVSSVPTPGRAELLPCRPTGLPGLFAFSRLAPAKDSCRSRTRTRNFRRVRVIATSIRINYALFKFHTGPASIHVHVTLSTVFSSFSSSLSLSLSLSLCK